jgi:hypothetical protein
MTSQQDVDVDHQVTSSLSQAGEIQQSDVPLNRRGRMITDHSCPPSDHRDPRWPVRLAAIARETRIARSPEETGRTLSGISGALP